jgi:hypothetical protein
VYGAEPFAGLASVPRKDYVRIFCVGPAILGSHVQGVLINVRFRIGKARELNSCNNNNNKIISIIFHCK